MVINCKMDGYITHRDMKMTDSTNDNSFNARVAAYQYIRDMVKELGEIASNAGLLDLASDLQVLFDKHPPQAKSSGNGASG